MKKIILIALGAFTLTASAQRFGTLPNQDNTGASLKYSSKSQTIGSTDSIAPNAYESFYAIPVAAAKTLHIKNTNAKLWDKCIIRFAADATTRLITLTGINMLSDINRDTVSVMSSRITVVQFLYDGTKWMQVNRYQQH